MTGNPGKHPNSVLPLNARCERIAAGGGLAASLQEECPAGGNEAKSRSVGIGRQPDGPEMDMPGRSVKATAAPEIPAIS